MTDGFLSAELERALLHAVAETWHDLNATFFKRRMQPPAFLLDESDSRLGQWRPETRTIALQRRFVVERGWGVVVEVLKHEMAHQYTHEILGATDETAHGPAFRQVCEALGIDAAAAGLPDAPTPGEAPREGDARVLSRIAKLLALAESSNRHEAEAAMAEAQRLMLRHNLEAVSRRAYSFRHLGRPTGRTTEAERVLANLLQEFFFVEVIWVPVWRVTEGKRASMLEVCGSTVNLDMAEHVHTFLTRTADRLWDEYKTARGIRSNRDRQTFLAGVMIGFRDKLASARRRHEAEGLVWVGDGDLARYLRQRHPRIVTRRSYGSERTEAHGAGRAAGREIVLHRPVASQSNRGRLLPGR